MKDEFAHSLDKGILGWRCGVALTSNLSARTEPVFQ